MSSLLLSLKPRYADLVFEGLKKAELRRNLASQLENREVYIYVSSPVCALRGGFRVGQIWSGSPEEIWSIVSDLASVEKQEFDAYYAGKAIAYALEITAVWEYARPVDLSELRNWFPNFVVPQSWRYIRPEETPIFHSLKRREDKELTGSENTVQSGVPANDRA